MLHTLHSTYLYIEKLKYNLKANRQTYNNKIININLNYVKCHFVFLIFKINNKLRLIKLMIR